MKKIRLGQDDSFISLDDKLKVLSSFAKWVRSELHNDGQELCRDFGLCYNLKQWLFRQDTTAEVDLAVKSVFRNLLIQGKWYPFGGYSTYDAEQEADTVYNNPERLGMLLTMESLPKLRKFVLGLPNICYR